MYSLSSVMGDEHELQLISDKIKTKSTYEVKQNSE